MIFPFHAGFEPTLPRWLSVGWQGSASAGKRTRAIYVTGEHQTTEPPMSAFIGFSKYTAFHVDVVFYVKYYLKSENRVLTLVVFVRSADLRPPVEICSTTPIRTLKSQSCTVRICTQASYDVCIDLYNKVQSHNGQNLSVGQL